MRNLITDVTEMHQGNFCIAGWCGDMNRMVRPLPGGRNWTALLLETHGIVPGTTIDFQASATTVPTGAYPHHTEDTTIDEATIQLVSRGPSHWTGRGAPPAATNLNDAFGGHVHTTGNWDRAKKGAHVKEGTHICSLAALNIDFNKLNFFEDTFQGKTSLRAYLEDFRGFR
jgi:hypothetical protein